jgi:hypothetical protein
MQKLMQHGIIKRIKLAEGAASHAIVFTCIQPGVIIKMETDIFLVYTKFRSPEEAEEKRHCFQLEERDYLEAGRTGEMATKLMLRLEGTEGLNYFHVLPTGLVSYLWPDTLKFAPAIIKRMKVVLTELCGEFHFINEPNVRIPTKEQIEASRRMGILLPI